MAAQIWIHLYICTDDMGRGAESFGALYMICDYCYELCLACPFSSDIRETSEYKHRYIVSI